MAASEIRRSVEELAQALYASDSTGIPWVKCGSAVRYPWLQFKNVAAGGGKAEP